MKLYSLLASPFAARVRAAIYAKGLDVQIISPPSDWRTSPEYRKLSPLVRIPVLILDDGSSLPESGVIVEYLEDAFPQTPLRPNDAAERARVRLITQVAELYVQPAMSPLFRLFDTKDRDEAAIEAQISKFDATLRQLNDLLRPGEYAVGNCLTTADLWLAPQRMMLGGLMAWSGRTELLDGYDALIAYQDLAQRDPFLNRVWQEMEEGVKAFMAARANNR
ncbi:MAG TPA: glutathione S-transferase family protein [Steroidobacteraceae bacterium]|nr:glutathione S-transferase family protein [Steroidobacteraceae bacterium]